MKLNDYLEQVKVLTCNATKNHTPQDYVSFKRPNLPDGRGIYLIYSKEDPHVLMYVGCAHREGRTIKIRCGQNLAPKDSGGTFRKRVEARERKTPQEAVEFIKENCVLKFIVVPGEMESRDILLLERACISSLSPQCNDLITTKN